MIPMAVPNLKGNEKKYLDDCVDTTFVSSVGEYVTRFEKMVADATGASEAVATSCGTTGLHSALMAVGVKAGDLVIIPAFTFIATANSVRHCGAEPWIMEVSPSSWCMDADIVKREIEENCAKDDSGVLIHKELKTRVAAIMPVYTLGNAPDMDAFRTLADEYGVPLIADAACAIGTELKGKKLGEFADLSVLSFNGNKTITCGGGGAVVGNDLDLLAKVRHLTTTARVWPDYDFDEVGYNYRMTNIQAAVGVAQMERLEKFVNTKRKVRDYYKNAFSDMNAVDLFPTTDGASCWFSGIILPEECQLEDAKKVCAALKDKGIESRPFWKPIHLQKPYENCIKSDLQYTDSMWQRIITLPCSTNITDDQLECVKEAVRDALKEMVE